MKGERAYSSAQFVLAIFASAAIGWALGTIFGLLAGRPLPTLESALFELGGALAGSWTIAAPILWWVMKRPIDWLSAAGWGLAISMLMLIVDLATATIVELAMSATSGMVFDLTSVAWNSLILAAVGVGTALIVRAVIGAGAKAVTE